MRGGSGLKTVPASTRAPFIDYKRTPAGRAVSIVGAINRITVKGWATDPDTNAKLAIRVQVDDKWLKTTTRADKNVSGVTGPAGNHEFRVIVKANWAGTSFAFLPTTWV